MATYHSPRDAQHQKIPVESAEEALKSQRESDDSRTTEAHFLTPLMHSADQLPRSKNANIFARSRSEPYHTHTTWIIYVSTVHLRHWGSSRTLLTAFDTRVHRRVRIKLDLHILIARWPARITPTHTPHSLSCIGVGRPAV